MDGPLLSLNIDCSDAHTIASGYLISFHIQFWNHSTGPDTILPKLTLCYIIFAWYGIWYVFFKLYDTLLNFMGSKIHESHLISKLRCFKKGLQNGVSNLFRPRVFQSKENTGIDLLWPVVFIERFYRAFNNKASNNIALIYLFKRMHFSKQI